MMTRALLQQHVSSYRQGLSGKPELELPPENGFAFQCYNVDLAHPFQPGDGLDEAQRDCDEVLDTLKRFPGPTTREVVANLQASESPQVKTAMALTAVAGLGGLATLGAAVWLGSVKLALMGAAGLGSACWLSSKVSALKQDDRIHKQHRTDRLYAWASAVQAGCRGRLPLYQFEIPPQYSGACRSTMHAWAVQDSVPMVSRAMEKIYAGRLDVAALARGGPATSVQEDARAVVLGGTRLAKRR